MQGLRAGGVATCSGWVCCGVCVLCRGCGCVVGAGLCAGAGLQGVGLVRGRGWGVGTENSRGLTGTAQESTWDPSHFLKHGKVSQAAASPASRRQPSRAPPPRFSVGSAGSRITGLQSRRGG
jgi:hypothetical protein